MFPFTSIEPKYGAFYLNIKDTVHGLVLLVQLWSTLNSGIWPTPFSTGVSQNEESSPEGQRDKEISVFQFILSLFDRVGSSSLDILQVFSCADPGSSQLGTPVAKRCCRGFLEVYRVMRQGEFKDIKLCKVKIKLICLGWYLITMIFWCQTNPEIHSSPAMNNVQNRTKK